MTRDYRKGREMATPFFNKNITKNGYIIIVILLHDIGFTSSKQWSELVLQIFQRCWTTVKDVTWPRPYF